MSINIAVNGSSSVEFSHRKILQDPDYVRKEQTEKNRKLRLVQVREKSKELASKIRKNVALETQRQLRRIEHIKLCELEKWREKALSENKQIYSDCLQEIGSAHSAAQNEEREKLIPAILKPVPRTDVKRNKVPSEVPKKPSDVKRVKKDFSKHDKSKCSLTRKKKTPEHPKHVYPEVKILDTGDVSSNLENETKNSKTIPSKVKDISKLSRTPPVVFEVKSDEDSCASSVEDVNIETNMMFSKKLFRGREEVDEYNADKLASPQKKFKGPYSEISELIQNMNSVSNRTGAYTFSTADNELADKPFQYTEPEKPHEKLTSSSSDACVQRVNLKNKEYPTKRPLDRHQDENHKRVEYSEHQNRFSDTATTPSKPSSSVKSSKISSQKTWSSDITSRVQLYDYPNKFHKSYICPDTAVVKENVPAQGLNAIDEAKLELRLQEIRDENAKELRDKAEQRSKLAWEKEMAKKEYDSLTTKLEALSKDKEVSRGISRSDDHLQVENRLEQLLNERQKKMNATLENILQRPILITCPEVKQSYKASRLEKREKPFDCNDILDVGTTKSSGSDNDPHSFLNSSDSCTSVLLSYVDTQKHKLSQDIGECDNVTKKKKLCALLKKIVEIKENISSQVKSLSRDMENKELNEMLDLVQNVEKERKSIVSERKEIGKRKLKELENRERALIQKERELEEKLKEFNALQKQAKEKLKEADVAYVAESDDKRVVIVDNDSKGPKPVQIIIRLNNETKKENEKSAKSPKKVSSTVHTSKLRKKVSTGKPFIANVARRPKLSTPKELPPKITIPSGSTTSTLYKSPPQTMKTKFGEILEKAEKDGARTAKSTLPSSKTKATVSDARKKELNPVLRSYIERLLGMTSTSVDMLGISSSDVQTPSSSIINISGNMSLSGETKQLENGKIDQVKKFIDDNYNLLQEVDESLKSDRTIDSSQASEPRKQTVWRKKLEKVDTIANKENAQQESPPVRPILKKQKKITPTQPEAKKSEAIEAESEKIDLVHKYTVLADNCSQRIAELNEMINKVRKEKQKILEITLSSNSDTGRNSTEYMDFAAERNAGRALENASKTSEDKSLVLSQEPDYVQLEKNKLTGVSRDSGISMSRPVTALDTHDSPESYANERPPAFAKSKECFSPLLKEIPKSMPVIQHVTATLQNFNITTKIGSTIDSNVVAESEQKLKKTRPPVSLARFNSGEIEAPHELSTIIEVDTPATSRINASLVDKESKVEIAKQKENGGAVSYSEFLTFEEYARKHNLDITKFDLDSSSKLPLSIKDLTSFAKDLTDLEYKQFPSPKSDLTEHVESMHETLKSLADSLEKIQINYQKFPSPQQYAQEAGITSLLDSKTIEELSESPDSIVFDGSEDIPIKKSKEASSEESILNVVEELKKRNILLHPFEVDPNEKLDLSQLTDSSSQKTMTDGQQSEKNRKKSPAMEKADKTPPSNDANKIEKDLQAMGLTWAALMLKKSQQSQALSSSSSSSIGHSVLMEKLLRENFDTVLSKSPRESSSTESGGKPINLKEFLAKELERRTNASCSSTEDSISSQFLRSLLNSSSSSTPKVSSNGKNNQDRIRTSTPVVTWTSSSQAAKSGAELTLDLFSGESRLSSVKFNSQSSKSNNEEASK